MSESPQEGGELRLAAESIEALASRIAEIVAAAAPPPPSRRRDPITAEEVARWWRIGRRWVYDHADELGARRLGAGPRPRLRFDPDEVAERLGAPADGSGSAPMRGDFSSDSLSAADRAMFAGQAKTRPGAAVVRPPDPAPNRRRNK